MKRVFQHPPEPLTGKKYWRSLGEYSNTPEFREWLEREFPAGASDVSEDEWSRRDFMKLMGASMALAGVGLTSCRRPEMHLVPFTKSAEWTIPGKFLYYATAMPRRTGAIPLIATTVDGRPIKLEGTPLHPASGGATDTSAQASILELYDPSRSQRFVHKGKRSDPAAFDAYMGELRNTLLAQQGEGLAFLATEMHSPTRERLRTELEKTFPALRWCVYEPLLNQAQQVAKPGAVQLLVYAINAALKNLGQTLVVRQVLRNPQTTDILQLAADMNDGQIKQLFILGGDPVYNAQRGLVEDRETKLPLDWIDLQKKVPEIVRFGYHEDSTSALSEWHVPAAHYLESWSDALT